MKGLTSSQASQFLSKYGLNVIAEHKSKTFLAKLVEQFNNFLTILLIGAAVISFFIGEPIDGALILSIVILNAFFGLYQEAKAEQSLAALKQMTVTKVRVIRDGREQEIDSKYLVPGDMVFIEEGVKISADGEIIEEKNLEINEAALTGESLPVVKQAKEELFMGTIVSRGRGFYLVTKTGMKTKFGQIASELSQVEETKTPLQKKLENLTRFIGIVGIFAAFIVFILSLFQGGGYFPAFLLAVSLAVAVVPEGLPAVMTITLAIGVGEMAKKKAIIRKLSSIEALGGITLIATDKTGTLTTNKMKVKEMFVDNKIILNPKSEIRNPKQIQNSNNLNSFENSNLDNLNIISNLGFSASNLKINAFSLLLLDGILNSTASLVQVHDHGSWDVLGDPTEGSLLYLAQSLGQDYNLIRKEWEIVDEQPFDSVTKRMSVVVEHQITRGDPGGLIFSKGAPESILAICNKQLVNGREEEFDLEEKEKVEKQVMEWGSKGLRVLAFAYKNIQRSQRTDNRISDKSDDQTSELRFPSSDLSEMIFLGMVAIHDAPRPEAKEAVERAKLAGIKVVMITGDNEKTAETIGVQLGIVGENDEILTGFQLENYTDEELMKKLAKVKVFARTTPFQKNRIVKLYQKLGEVVAVTGDGVNDAIALKQADCGVAMGLVGTDVARETADMIVTDDNFASIINAIEEGRNIIKNIKNAITYLLACNISEALALIIGMILGFPAIFYAIQFLYINLVTDGLPALALAFSPRNPHLMKESPNKEMTLINPWEQKYIFAVGGIAAVLVLASYYFFTIYQNEFVGKAAAFTVLTLAQSFIYIDLWLSHQSFRKNFKRLFSSLFIFVFAFPFILQYIIVSSEKTANLFKVIPVSPLIFSEFVFIAGLVFVGIKGVKVVLGKKT